MFECSSFTNSSVTITTEGVIELKKVIILESLVGPVCTLSVGSYPQTLSMSKFSNTFIAEPLDIEVIEQNGAVCDPWLEFEDVSGTTEHNDISHVCICYNEDPAYIPG